MALNQIVIMGRLTATPELKSTPGGTSVTSFTLAVERDFKGKETGKKETDFIDCVAWRNTAEFVSKYFAKGRMAAVIGRLQIRDYTDSNGNKRRTAEVVAENVYFADSGNANASQQTEPSNPAQFVPPAPRFEEISDDDLPF